MDKQMFGRDLRKWYIVKRGGAWLICPPVNGNPDWSLEGGMFPTGAEALAAFAGKRWS